MKIDALNPVLAAGVLPAAPAAGGAARVKEEFLTVFYEQLLKQVFKAPDFNPAGNNDEDNQGSSFTALYANELLARTLAEQMAKNTVKNGQWVALAQRDK